MMRVFFLYRLKRVFYSWWTKLSLLVLFAVGELLSVSFANVWINLSAVDGAGERLRYLLKAALSTELTVQALFVGILISAFLLLRSHLPSPRAFFFWRFA